MGEMRCACGEGLAPRGKASPARSAMYAGLGAFNDRDTLGAQGLACGQLGTPLASRGRCNGGFNRKWRIAECWRMATAGR